MVLEKLLSGIVGISRQVGKLDDEAFQIGLATLFDRAKYRIWIVSGELPYKFYGKDPLASVIRQARKRGSGIEVIGGPGSDEDSKRFLLSTGGSVSTLGQRPIQHFAVVDGKHVRLEEPHEEGQLYRTQYIIFNFKYAQLLEKRFITLKSEALPWRPNDVNT